MVDIATKDFFLAKVDRYCAHVGILRRQLDSKAIGTQGAAGFSDRVEELDMGSIAVINRVEAFMKAYPDGWVVRGGKTEAL